MQACSLHYVIERGIKMNGSMSCLCRKITMGYWALRTLRRIARDLRSFEDGRIPKDTVDVFFLNLQTAYRELLVQEQVDGLY